MRVIGLDVGSRTVKRVTVDGGVLRDFEVVANNHDPLSICEKLVAGQRADRIVATGYGRHLLATHWNVETLTEIRAAAVGVCRLHPRARTLVDIGGQDTKVVSLGSQGAVAKFEMNDRCAAGTGRFLEVMATALSYRMSEFVEAARSADASQGINAMCTVFAESEVVSATARGVDRARLARGLHEAVVRRVSAMLRRVPVEDEVIFCGGGALNACLHDLLCDALHRRVVVPEQPQIVAALGAALSFTGDDRHTDNVEARNG